MRVESVDSTNNAIKRMVESGAQAEEGLILLADTQTAGRGRAGRPWLGQVGNLYASILLDAPDPTHRAAEIGFIAALALIDAIQTVAPDHASDDVLKCKWPNDVMCSGAKVAGILLELVSSPSGPDLVILGIGVNIYPVDVPNAIYPVTSLAENQMEAALPRLLEALAHALAPRLNHWRRDGFASVRSEWLSRCIGQGQPIVVNAAHEKIHGIFADIDTDGALVVQIEDGSRRRVLAGDVMLAGRA